MNISTGPLTREAYEICVQHEGHPASELQTTLSVRLSAFGDKVETIERENTALRTQLKAAMETAAYWEGAQTRERSERQKEIGMQEYRGNTISYIYDKERAYGKKFDELRTQLDTANAQLTEVRAMRGTKEATP